MPTDNRVRILKALKKCDRTIVVYNIDDQAENKRYSKVHNLMWQIQKAGLIEYSRNISGPGNYMEASITLRGIDWLNTRRNTRLILWTAIIGTICSLIGVLIDYFRC